MRVTVLTAIFALGGCASYSVQDLNEAMSRGDCVGAEAKLQQFVQRGDPEAMNNLGVVAENCRRDIQTAINHYSLSARMGSNTARINLSRLGQPVPAPDLVQRSSMDNGALGLMLLRAAQPKPMPSQTTHCRTVYVGGGYNTVCD